ncbi:MAG: aspartate/glutamate racemase family protein [Deltaproteobacteria bacterium]|nr:aspartate/glutamate racemase family protein [Deltaproteobacteria bacterium]MBW1963547.1 aspartate/glutamate racemase family protein [Deltaproteobacteria bacterium]MBW2154512.1 aspartate/glutamate racemase family protein [Deltaproteobacteria bacterium]
METKKPLVGVLHSTRFVVEPVHSVIASKCAGVDVFHIVDEGILRVLFEIGHITDRIIDWLAQMARSAQGTGADLAVLSCSSLSPAVNAVQKQLSIPFIKIDEPMAERAVQVADKIGLVATNHTTPKPSALLIQEVADRLGRKPQIIPRVKEDAFMKLSRGDIEGHDTMVIEAVEELLGEVDVVLLAQISIARVKEKLDEDIKGRVYSSLDFIGSRIDEMLSAKSR